MRSIQSFFLFCSGVNPLILKRSPADLNKYTGIGATVFFTGVFAALAGTYACYTVFGSLFSAVLFGLVWGLMIFNLDRYLVSSMKRKGSAFKDFTSSLPRIMLAVLIALVISKPLELKIFESEIESELVLMEQEASQRQEAALEERFTVDLAKEETSLTNLQSDVQRKEELKNQLVTEAIKEADGTGGSMQKNLGPIYKTKRAAADRAEEEYALAQVELNTQKEVVQDLRTQISEAKAALASVPLNGFAARLEALDRVAERSPIIGTASLFILLLFIAIECAPIFVKLISSRSPYDFVLDKHEHKYEMSHKLQTTKLNNYTNAEVAMDTEIKHHKSKLMTDTEKKLAQELVDKEYEKLRESVGWKDIFRRRNVLGFED